jgi:hypothetical protein
MTEFGRIVAICVIVLIFVSGLVYFFKSAHDCSEQGGHLAKDAYTGIYKCYDREVK